MPIAKTVKEYLASRGVSYRLLRHGPSETSRETAEAALIPDDHLVKAVLLKDGVGFLMAVIPGNHWVRVNRIREDLNRHLELASEVDTERLFADCRPGAIPPLGPAYGIETILDDALVPLARVYLEAGDHRHLLQLEGDAFRTLLAGCRQGYWSHPG
ncbi:aminoacyl-tRNA deacylase [Zobellella maritima]|uniref:aminoacyl-tRNA deacylase n=1 Tax=Zobellella maritima TaxID=2059725 RepID=UPI000E3062BA|nr:YbaK/EbsC family protein [Zobellella maritima]